MRLSVPALVAAAVLLGLSVAAAQSARLIDPAHARADSLGTLWYDGRDIGVEGKGWTDTEGYYDRFPARAKGVVREPVWDLSRDAAGLLLRFRTDADSILVDWDGGEGMPHFAPTGVSGLDLYVWKDSRWVYDWTARPDTGRTVRRIGKLNKTHEMRDCIINLPLYHGVTRLALGLPAGARLYSLPPPPGKPVVIYGTSITQGGCASRPGMAHSQILGRWLNREVINLGFSGNGMLEPEVATLLAELDPAVYVIDCIPNVGNAIGHLTVPFVKTLRAKHPLTPILLVEDPRGSNALANDSLGMQFKQLTDSGDHEVFLLRGEGMLEDDGESTVDGVHPTDLGFMRMARHFRPAIEVLLRPGE
ncbi:SGNH/GDSL hydrolase family protein [bacterium]|nr:SGNH/GDSL hydrolase family protein [bacterium]